MSPADEVDYLAEFLELHRRHKAGALTPAEVGRWRSLKDQLTQPAGTAGERSPGGEWDPEREPLPGRTPTAGDGP